MDTKIAFSITKDDGRPLGHIINYGGRHFLIDSRKVEWFYETMVFSKSYRKHETWNFRNPVYEKRYVTEEEMRQGHSDFLEHLDEYLY